MKRCCICERRVHRWLTPYVLIGTERAHFICWLNAITLELRTIARRM